MKPRYYVTTWDADKGEYTPQKGVRTGPWSLWGLRKAILALRSMGYSADYDGKTLYGDPSVRIERSDLR
jgi:hypothetical protein